MALSPRLDSVHSQAPTSSRSDSEGALQPAIARARPARGRIFTTSLQASRPPAAQAREDFTPCLRCGLAEEIRGAGITKPDQRDKHDRGHHLLPGNDEPGRPEAEALAAHRPGAGPGPGADAGAESVLLHGG